MRLKRSILTVTVLITALTIPSLAQRGGAAQTPAADDPVKTLAGRLELEKYKAILKGLAQFGDRRQGTERNPEGRPIGLKRSSKAMGARISNGSNTCVRRQTAQQHLKQTRPVERADVVAEQILRPNADRGHAEQVESGDPPK